ncbi:hypothetical protein [Arenimonas fontis]|uniref:Uncharacterized protein n=1 Tax=Arenimonas fontis TaxID=2608255 RepID=A0A5B2ZAM0_9GAMM|nr:hypothetical protein [Arenimonas fontis]KAA2284360.1 hypothetical protein F0415_09860 [Arenimonas fontis]
MRMHPLFLSLLLPLLAGPALAAPTPEEVGDADSFGRNLKWLGLMDGSVTLEPDCTGDPTGTCVTLNPAPAPTSFRVNDVGSIALPRRSTRSLLCHWQTPIVFYTAGNTTGATQDMQFRAYPIYRIQSPVLDDPTLINPITGLPFGGELELPLSSFAKFASIPDGSYESEQLTFTRACIAGLLSRRSLELSYGLSPAQARDFFREPITIHMDIAGTARMIESASVYFGTRFTGD